MPHLKTIVPRLCPGSSQKAGCLFSSIRLVSYSRGVRSSCACDAVANDFLALHMPAVENDVYSNAGLAVDGNTSTFAYSYSGPDGPLAFWQVDLAVPCVVYSVTIIAPHDGSVYCDLLLGLEAWGHSNHSHGLP